MIMNKILSVIVPVYNEEAYLVQCIESIRKQTLKDIEIILIDDGSTDKSGAICDKYADLDKRIKVFHTKNRGLLLSRKLGVEKACSDYITFVDADDFVAEVSFELALADMQDKIDVIAYDKIVYFEKDHMSIRKHIYDARVYSARDIEKYIYPTMIWNDEQNNYGLSPSLCIKIFKAELIKAQYGATKDANIYYGEDTAIIYPLMRHVKSLSIHHKAYYYHRQRGVGTIAPYLFDDLFCDKLFFLYRYLRDEFWDNEPLKNQITLWYIHSINYQAERCGIVRHSYARVFPFDKVSKGERIVLYGAGNIGKEYEKQLSSIDYCKVVLWVDKNFHKYNSIKVVSPVKIQTVEFDKIVIAVKNDMVKEKIKENILELGVNEAKIL